MQILTAKQQPLIEQSGPMSAISETDKDVNSEQLKTIVAVGNVKECASFECTPRKIPQDSTAIL